MSKRKGAHVSVKARECRGNHEKMIRKFIKKCKKAKIIEQIRDRRYFKKPSDVKRHAKQAAIRRQRRDVAKQKAKQAARERNS
ncbi:MAG: 30S ribosomal protein S21 [Candidatus Thorarchaeota archaeon]|jgi:small subunit ribosomal protein S21